MGDIHRRLIAFDLDGTLVDSRRDLTDSANQLIDELGGAPLSEDAVGRMVGEGAALLVSRALDAAGLGDRPGALARFLDRAALSALFHDRWSRDAAGGVADAVLRRAVTSGSLVPDRVLFLTDTEAGLRAAARVGVHPILMMNDPDEAMRLTACDPAGGIVSLHELPDFVRLVAARHAR